eukprot:scaffold34825_cov129-Isochrysis_galbana.AAC.1
MSSWPHGIAELDTKRERCAQLACRDVHRISRIVPRRCATLRVVLWGHIAAVRIDWSGVVCPGLYSPFVRPVARSYRLAAALVGCVVY